MPALDDRIAPVGDLALRLTREFPGIDELDGGITAQREPLLSTVLVAVEDRPGAHVVRRHPQGQPGRRIVEIVDASACRRFQASDGGVVESPTPRAAGGGFRKGNGFRQKVVGMAGFEPATP